VQALRDHPLPAGKNLYQYKMCFYGIDFSTHLRTPIVDNAEELNFGVSKLSPEEKGRYFLSQSEFIQLYKNGQDLYCVTDNQEKVNELVRFAPDLRVTWSNGNYFLVHMQKKG
jgi:hypothetical protein